MAAIPSFLGFHTRASTIHDPMSHTCTLSAINLNIKGKEVRSDGFEQLASEETKVRLGQWHVRLVDEASVDGGGLLGESCSCVARQFFKAN
jgi:hypothetical protein